MGTFQNAVQNGFQMSVKQFHLPADTLHLEPRLKRELTICNLFVNHHLPAADVARILDEDYEHVVLSLIKHHVVLERRRATSSPSQIERRRAALRGK